MPLGKTIRKQSKTADEINYNELLIKYRELSEKLSSIRRENELLKQQNQKASLFKKEFLGNISHEIKTPFYGILNSVSLLKNNNRLNNEDNFNLTIIEQNSQYLLTVFNNIIDYYNIDNMDIRLDNINFSLKNEFTPLLQYYRKKSEKKGLEFQVDFNRNIPVYLKGDPNRIKQIIHQLLSNSVKYTTEGIINVKIDAHNINGFFELTLVVSDTGVGFDEKHQKKIWQLFSFVDEEINISTFGVGIGLSLVKKLVELMNGKITVNSKKGKGSTFIISIPLKPGEADSKEVFNNVLLVEDNIINQRLTKALLEKQGFKVDTASNGKIGIEKYRQNNYDLVLMDIQMPVMDGFESAKHIRNYENLNPLIKPATIVAVSANSDKNNLSRLNEAGIDYFINKPFNMEKFSALLGNLEINRKKA